MVLKTCIATSWTNQLNIPFFSARIYHSAVATLGMDHLAIAGSLSPLPFGISPSLGVIPFLSWSRVVQSVLRNSNTASNWASYNATHTSLSLPEVGVRQVILLPFKSN